MDLRASVTRAVSAARAGQAFDPRHRHVTANGPQGAQPAVRREQVTWAGSPDTIVQHLRAFHERCGVGVVDLGFQHAGTSHREVMQALELFGKEVLPCMREF